MPLKSLIAIAVGFALLQTASFGNEPLKALIIDGQNNHVDWPKTTQMMKRYLEELGGFRVDVARTKFTWNGHKHSAEFPLDDGNIYQDLPQPKSDPDFRPAFSDYNVVISNFGHNAAAWPDETKESLQTYVESGGGFVVVHAANNAFPKWKEYNQMIGLGGWGGRNQKSGPYVYLNDKGETVRDTSPGGGGGHGPQHNFQIVSRNPEHPIMKGLPSSWLHTKDELYHALRGPAENMTILATAFSAKKFGGTQRHEPIIMVLDYGKGKVFHTPMGHADYSVECAGFITVFVRGCQWATGGKVSLMAVPDDFPTRDQSSSRKFAQPTEAAGS